MTNTTGDHGQGDGDLRDDALRQALLHAPDHAATPNWRLRKAILDHAHEVVTSLTATAAPEPVRSWWQRLWGVGGGGQARSRTPWRAAFATVFVAVLAALLWQREPVPGARPDGDAGTSAPAQRKEAPSAPVVTPSAAPVPAPAPPPPAAERALPASEDIPGGPVPAPEPPAEATAAKESRAKEAVAPIGPPAAASRGALSEPSRNEVQGAARQRFAAPTGPSPGAGAAGDAAGPARETRANAPPPPAPPQPPQPPSFAALSQWSRITITQPGGTSRSLSRPEAQDLGALLGSAAISAVGSQPLAGTPEWRVTLERSNGDVLATFDLGRSQVRWREGRGTGTTGTPSAGSLAALRDALQHAVEQPAQPESPPLRWKPPPPQPAEPETAPAEAPSR